MFFSDGGYSEWQYDNRLLRSVVSDLVIAIPHYMKLKDAQAIAVTGKSGLSMAFATLSHIGFPLIVVRKEGELSHGMRIEGTQEVNVSRYLVLDDFVSSGNTVRNIVTALNRRAGEDSYCNPVCAGVLAYTHGKTDSLVKLSKGLTVPIFGTLAFTGESRDYPL